MPDDSCLQRLTRLEVNQEQIFRDYKKHSEREEAFHEEQSFLQKEHSKLLSEIKIEQARMKSFWGGMVFSATAMGACVVLLIKHLLNLKS